MCCVSIPQGRDRLRAFSRRWRGYLPWRVHFGFVRFFMAISTGYRGHGRRGTRNGGWRRGLCASLRNHISSVGLSAGSTLGLNVEAALRPPQTAPKSLRLSGLSSRCGGVVLVRIRGACASLRSRIGLASLSAGSTLGLNVEAALRPPQTVPKSRMWKRHCRLSGLSSGAGRVRKCSYAAGKVRSTWAERSPNSEFRIPNSEFRIAHRRAVTRVHGKT